MLKKILESRKKYKEYEKSIKMVKGKLDNGILRELDLIKLKSDLENILVKYNDSGGYKTVTFKVLNEEYYDIVCSILNEQELEYISLGDNIIRLICEN